MSDAVSLQRVVVCIDGVTSSLSAFGSTKATTISRIADAVRPGLCLMPNGNSIQQTLIHNRAVENTYLADEQIEHITKSICQTVNGPQDEVFLYGSGHGAYIVRAVAGVLHHLGVPKDWSMVRFHEIFLTALDLYKARRAEDSVTGLKLVENLNINCDDCPVIKFVGVFDTIKKKTDNTIYDLSFNASTKIFRHAMALNEEAADLIDVPISGEAVDRSLVQAWFVGSNSDLCGGAQYDGLSLYPLQWMLVESIQAGLILEPSSASGSQESSLKLAFPRHAGVVPAIGGADPVEWRFRYINGIEISMFDLQATHAAGRGKTKGLNSVHLKGETTFYSHPRRAFGTKGLVGWSEKGSASTIVHPSVYCILDRYPKISENQRFKATKKDLANFQEQCMEGSDGMVPPWLEGMQLQANGVKAFRILVCGKTGVGKSTLINKVFGVEMTQESDTYAQGAHDINQAFESPSNPGLLIHDSRGWQAGSNEELDLIAQFLGHRAAQKDPAEALHVIWFCVDSDVSRIEEADRKTFEVIAQHSHQVPIFIIGTKKDKIANFRKMQLLEKYLESDSVTDLKAANQLVTQQTEQEVKRQFSELIAQFSQIKHYRADGYVCLSKNDEAGVKDLLEQTLGLIADERVRLFCVAAQVVSVDQKISSAITETIRLGTHAVRTAMVPLPCSEMLATPTISRLLCEHILQCFGFPKAAPEAVDEIMMRVVMEKLKGFMKVAVTQFFVVGTPIMFAAAPTARMLLKCACDMILILDRSFSYGGKFVSVKQIEDAAKYYTKSTVTTFGGRVQLLQQRVHDEIDKMLPLSSFAACRFAKVRVGLEEIIQRNRYEKSSVGNRSQSGSSTRVHELDGNSLPADFGEKPPLPELAGDTVLSPPSVNSSVAELPSTSSVTESAASSYGISSTRTTTDSLSELPADTNITRPQPSHRKSDIAPNMWGRSSMSKISAKFSLRKTKTKE